MLDRADGEIAGWITEILGQVKVSCDRPIAETGDMDAVSSYLLDVKHVAGTSTPDQVRFRLLYLITTSSRSPQQAHALLGRLMLAALEQPQMAFHPAPESLSLWQPFGLPPRAALFLNYDLLIDQQPKSYPRVTRSPAVSVSGMYPVAGQLLGPEGQPLAGCRIELPGFRRGGQTDARGYFQLGMVTANARALEFRIYPPGGKPVIRSVAPVPDAAGMVIRLEQLE